VQVRVHQIVTEYGLTSKRLLAELKELGEYLGGPSSIVLAPVQRRLRARLATQGFEPEPPAARVAESEPVEAVAEPAPALRVQPPPRGPLGIVPRPPGPYEWYRGEPLGGLAKFLLDGYVIQSRDEDDKRNLRPGKYFVREVKRARQYADDWAWALAADWTYDEILTWLPVGVSVDYATALKHAGVRPDELGWHHEDQGRLRLSWRLMYGTMTVDQVILEVVGRRARAND
jgi:hypothetical protein